MMGHSGKGREDSLVSVCPLAPTMTPQVLRNPVQQSGHKRSDTTRAGDQDASRNQPVWEGCRGRETKTLTEFTESAAHGV